MILDANVRVGDSWRKRWDSLRLFTPAKYSSLPRLSLPVPGHHLSANPYQRSKIPTFSSKLDPEIMQVYSSEYRNPEQLRDGDVLVVGAGNSGAEIALEPTNTRHTWLSGRDTQAEYPLGSKGASTDRRTPSSTGLHTQHRV